MTDCVILNEKGLLSAKFSFVLNKSEEGQAFIGNIRSFDIPFSAKSVEGAKVIVTKLIQALFSHWFKLGGMQFAEEKLKGFHFKEHKTQQADNSAIILENLLKSIPSQEEYQLELNEL